MPSWWNKQKGFKGFSGNIEKGFGMVNKISSPSPVCFGTGFDAFFGT
jgi:hypothetical protein